MKSWTSMDSALTVDPELQHSATTGGLTFAHDHHSPPLSPIITALRRSTTKKHTPVASPRTHHPAESLTNSESNLQGIDTILSRAPGAEPGIDPRRESSKRQYGHIHEECEIEIIDYCEEHVKFHQFEHNGDFLNFMDSKVGIRPPAIKVRWINIAGISWDVMSALALKYQLHPLAIEDVFTNSTNSRSKADYYRNHLFVHLLCIASSSKKASPLHAKYLREDATLVDDEDSDETEESDIAEEEEDDNTLLRRVSTRRTRKRRRPTVDSLKPKAALRWMESAILLSPEARKRQERIAKLNALKKKGRVRVVVSNAFLFLFKDGTVISIHSSDRSFGNPIYQRLRHPDTVLRKDPDPSLLIHSIIDLVVDQALIVVDKYSDKINELETDILMTPDMDVVKGLHIVSADLTSRKRNMQPMKALIYGLRRFDVERTAAALGPSASIGTQGYMSPKAKVYLSDVADHLDNVLSSLDQYSTMVDNLIDFAFNMSSNATNTIMARLTIVTAIFLPLTVLTGYFGMNFAFMDVVQKHSDSLFWIIAVPVMAVLLPIAFWSDIRKMFRYIGKMRILSRVGQRHNTKVRKAKEQHRRVSIREGKKRREKTLD